MMPNLDTWERFKVARARAGLTLQEVARICDVTPQAVKKWEDGYCMPSSRRLMDLCVAFDCSLEWIMNPNRLDFHSTEEAPQGLHAKYWVGRAMDEYFARTSQDTTEHHKPARREQRGAEG